jgi:hypothetical protein
LKIIGHGNPDNNLESLCIFWTSTSKHISTGIKTQKRRERIEMQLLCTATNTYRQTKLVQA